MKFGLAIISTLKTETLNPIVKLSDEMEKYLKNRNYGNDVKMYTIGVHCENIPPGFEKFAELPKPKYIKGRKTIHPEGIPFTMEDSFEYSIKLDFETFKNGTEEENSKLLAKAILSSLSILDAMKSKIKDFDADRFKADLESYFKEKGLV